MKMKNKIKLKIYTTIFADANDIFVVTQKNNIMGLFSYFWTIWCPVAAQDLIYIEN